MDEDLNNPLRTSRAVNMSGHIRQLRVDISQSRSKAILRIEDACQSELRS